MEGLPIRQQCKPSPSSSVTPGVPEQALKTEPAPAVKVEPAVTVKEEPQVKKEGETAKMVDVEVCSSL
jgi:hypothetical protein